MVASISTCIVTSDDVILVYVSLSVVDIILLVLGYFRERELI